MVELLLSIAGVEVWHGDCLDPETVAAVMQGRKADLLHTDAPYSAKTHDGHKQGKLTAERAAGFGATNPETPIGRYASKNGIADARSDIEYASWSPDDVATFNALWLPFVDGWATTITDHVLQPAWSAAFEAHKLYTFPPLPWVELGSRVRMAGDGPSMWSCQLIVARPRRMPFSKWGTLPGAYVGPGENHQNRPDRVTGGKSIPLTCNLLRDYSRDGALVVDPCLGGGTTALAALKTGRRCIGIEKDRGRAELCAELARAEALGTTRQAMQRGQVSIFGVEATK